MNRLTIATLLVGIFAAAVWAQVSQTNVAQVGGATPISAICDDPAKGTTVNINLGAGTGNTELVALSGSTVIYVCGWQLQASAADVPQWISGTGTACATGETDKVTFRITADGDGSLGGFGIQWLFKTAAGEALCVERTASVALYGFVKVVQQ